MQKISNQSYTIPQSATVVDALRRLNELSGISTTIFVVDNAARVVGSITDGDLRRAIVAGMGLECCVSDVMHRDFVRFGGSDVNIDDIRAARARKIAIVPCLNCDGTLREVVDLNEYHTLLPLDAVLMAGGRGERLRPLTLETPKPLLRIGDKCIIDYNIDALCRCGVRRVYVTVNYLSDLMEEHFAAMPDIICVKEPKRLGTIGSLSLISDWKHDNILVMNADLLTSINFEEFYMSHVESGALMSIASIPYTVSVPYAILQGSGNSVTGLEEKPTYNYFANAGIYLIRRDALRYIPSDEYFDATDLVEAILADGKSVNRYTLTGTWIDIGSPDDFRQAQELIRQHKQLNF